MNDVDSFILEARDLTCCRNGQLLFKEVNITLQQGEFLQIHGPNGVGKSSLLRIFSGLLPYSGTLKIATRPSFQRKLESRPALHAIARRALWIPRSNRGMTSRSSFRRKPESRRALHDNARSALGVPRSSCVMTGSEQLPLKLTKSFFYIGHQLALKPEFTAMENVLLDCRYQMPSKKQAKSLLEKIGLAQCAELKTLDLSQGQRQRLALGRCLHAEESLWILDEPLVALDELSRMFWLKQMEDHLKRGGSLVIASHQPLLGLNCSGKHMELLPC